MILWWGVMVVVGVSVELVVLVVGVVSGVNGVVKVDEFFYDVE